MTVSHWGPMPGTLPPVCSPGWSRGTQAPGILEMTGQLNRGRLPTHLCLAFLFWPYHAACGILVPQAGIKPALEAQNLDHWTIKEVPLLIGLTWLPRKPLVPMDSTSHLRVDMRWPHVQSGAACLVGRGCDLEEKVGIREAREREAGREELSWAERQLVFNRVLCGSRGRGARGRRGSCSAKCK